MLFFSDKTDFFSLNGTSDDRKLSIGPYLEIENSEVFKQSRQENLTKNNELIVNKSNSSEEVSQDTKINDENVVNNGLLCKSNVDKEKRTENDPRKNSMESISSRSSTKSRPRSYTNADETTDLIPETLSEISDDDFAYEEAASNNQDTKPRFSSNAADYDLIPENPSEVTKNPNKDVSNQHAISDSENALVEVDFPLAMDQEEEELSEPEIPRERDHSSSLSVPVIRVETESVNAGVPIGKPPACDISETENAAVSGGEDSSGVDIALCETDKRELRQKDYEEPDTSEAPSDCFSESYAKIDSSSFSTKEDPTISLEDDLSSKGKDAQADNASVFEENDITSTQTDIKASTPSPPTRRRAATDKTDINTRKMASSATPDPQRSLELSPRVSRRSNAVRRRSGKNSSVSSESGLLELDVQFKRQSCMPRESVASLTEFFESKTNAQLEQPFKLRGSTS